MSAARRLARTVARAAGKARVWSPAVERAAADISSSVGLSPSSVAGAIDPYLLQHPSLALSLFRFATRRGLPPDAATYHALFKSLSLSRRGAGAGRAAAALLARANAEGVRLSSESCHLAVVAILGANDARKAFDVLENLPPEAVLSFPAADYNALLAALSECEAISDARKLFDTMVESNVAFEDVGVGCFLSRVFRVCSLEDGLKLIDAVKVNAGTINGSVMAVLVANGLCRSGRIEDGWKALEELRLRGWKPDFIAYRIVSEGFRHAGRTEEEGRILKQKRKLGVAPRVDDYMDFILALIKERRLRDAKEVGEAIVLGDFPIADSVLSALVSSVSAVDTEAAIFFCNYMIKRGSLLSGVVLGNLCRNLCKNDKGDEMWSLFRALMGKNHFLTAQEYHFIVSFLCKAKKVKEAYLVLKEMKGRGVIPDIASYNSLMEALCRDDYLRPAKKLWDEMFTDGCAPNLQTYNILIGKFSEVPATGEACHLFNHMLQKGLTPDVSTYSMVITMLCRENKLETALEIFRKSVNQDVEVASLVLRSFILTLCNKGCHKEASDILHHVPVNVESSCSHMILLKSIIDSEDINMAVEHIKRIKSNCPFKLESIFNQILASLSTAPRIDTVRTLLQAMHSQGLSDCDSEFLNLLGDAYA